MTPASLSLLEARVLGVLIEKQHTVPDAYPLTLNALAAGCNQKSSREPVLEVPESDVRMTVDSLKRHSLVIETSGGRVMRYAHNFGRVFEVPIQSTALLAVLMLRGPQTVGELRINSERMHRFADTSSVEAFLRELGDRPAGALVVELPRQAGSREPRWAHLLSGPPAVQPVLATAASASSTGTRTPDEVASLRAEVARLAAELNAMKEVVTRLCKQLGVDDET
jgi:uncharacterized protein YceH (UPF0502 family)